MPATFRYIVALALCLVPGAVTGQETAAAPPLAWWPRLPLQGSLVRLVVRPPPGASVTAVSGELAGEPLHFEPFAEGFEALGAVPVGRRRVPRERLRVAPEFAEPPDSLTERIRLEQELVQGVRQRAHETPRLWQAPFLRPRASVVTSGFGVARVFNKVLRSRHWGVDFAGQRGDPVRASNRGVVALVADLYYSGTTVLIDHGAGLVTGDFHLSRVLVVPGDTVDVGQLIGRVGSSGRVTRSHLDWFAAYGRITVDPLDLIRANGPARFP